MRTRLFSNSPYFILSIAVHYCCNMTVSIDDFESGNLSQGPKVPEQVVTFLYKHRDQAFTRSEIASAIDEDPNTVGTALTRL
jgi:hypothetical protein